MPLKNYGVLKGSAVDRRLGQGQSPHYQIRVVDEDTDYRVAVNVKSQLEPSELLYLVDEDFRHPITSGLPNLPLGFTHLESGQSGLALDFIRGNLFGRHRMRALPFDLPGPDNDLNDRIDGLVLRAMADEEALVYAFGERWGPEEKKDKYFGFSPGNGIHDIHMNQGNVGRFVKDDGVWQDGALLVHFPTEHRWVAIFLSFQSQAWHTDDVTGHAIETVPPVDPGVSIPADPLEPDGTARIVAALVNPAGPAPEKETVTLLNASPQPIDLTGWALANGQKRKHGLSGILDPGASRPVILQRDVQLGNGGGIITLLDEHGLKVHGVSYTREQARREGWTIVF